MPFFLARFWPKFTGNNDTSILKPTLNSLDKFIFAIKGKYEQLSSFNSAKRYICI